MSATPDVKRALLALEKMQAKLNAVKLARTEPIAIIGMGCRFPGGAHDPDSYWQLLKNGVDAIREVPADRWDIDSVYDQDPAAAGKMYARWAGFIDNVDQFDPAFFGISAREANSMDPQQRLLLEVAWQALENAAIAPESLAGTSAAVFIGACSSDYASFQFADYASIDAWAGTGSAHSILANRLSYLLDLQGPSMAVDTACSSSLVAVYLACQSLRNEECNLAIAGGVNLILAPEPTMIFCRAQMMAADGRCKTFDSRADGYVRGEGAGVVILKRLSAALADGDPIHAVIRGSAVNQDGRSNGLAAPNLLAQQAVIRKALADGNLDPSLVGFVEAHGTGTSLGDPIEVEALAGVYGKPAAAAPVCLLGSAKTNIGHLEAAAGVAGLIKAALCLRHKEVPGNLHLRQLNPNISLQGTRFSIPTAATAWPASGPRFAAVSSFGFGGTNSHVVLESAPEPKPAMAQAPDRPLHLLTLSAKSPAALDALRVQIQELDPAAFNFADLCYTANTGRGRWSHRLAVVAPDLPGAQHQLASGDFATGSVAGDERPIVAFLFTGQGSQYPGMGRELYEASPVFRDAVERCGAILGQPMPALFDDAERLRQTAHAQPALFTLEWSLAQLWMSWGVQPDRLLGHSLGELVAACIAGVFSLEDALRLVAARGELMQRHSPAGAMAALFASPQEVRSLLGPQTPLVAIAAENGPTETIISGAPEQVAAVLSAAAAQGMQTRALSGQVAFHSPLMDPVLAPFSRVANSIVYAPARIPIVSNRTGRTAASEELSKPGYWVDQIRERVRFASGLQTLADDGVQVLIEIGPHPTLINIQQRTNLNQEFTSLPSLRRGSAEWLELLRSAAKFAVSGGRIDWNAFDRPYQRRRISIPTYPFQHARYWIGERPAPRSFPHLYSLAWREVPLPAAGPAATRAWLTVGGQPLLIAALEKALGPLTAAQSTEQVRAALADSPDASWTILDLTNLDATVNNGESGPELAARVASLAEGTLGLMHAAMEATQSAPRLVIVTRGGLLHAAARGLGRVFAHEHPALWGGLVDLDPEASEAESAANLAAILTAATIEDQWKLRAGKLHVARLERYAPAAPKQAPIDAAATYLVTGALGAIGGRTAEWLVERGARHLLLTGRRPPSLAEESRFAALRGKGVKVTYHQADLTDSAAVAAVIAAAGPALKGIVHCAGALDDGVILHQNRHRFLHTFSPKAGAAWDLHRHSLHSPLDFFLLFSSISGVLGTPGQSNYAAANVFLDELADYRRQLGLPALSIAWGPWDIGMNEGRRQLDGVNFITASAGFAMLDPLMGTSAAQVAVLPIDWPKFAASLPAGVPVPLLSGLLPARTKPAEPSTIRQEILALPPDQRLAAIKQYLQRRIGRAVGGELPAIDDKHNILDLGMDSLMIVEVLNDCRRDLSISLYPREIYARPTFGELCIYLTAEFDRSINATSSPAEIAEPALSPLSFSAPTSIPETRNPSMIFLLSSPRSGSTLLRVMLAGHPALFSPPELHLLAFEGMAAWGRTLEKNYLTQGLQRALMELKSIDAAAAASEVSSLIEEDRPVQEVYGLLQQLAGPRTLVDKSPSYAGSLATIQRAEALFEEPRYVFLVRHPYAVIESFARNRMQKLIGMDDQDPFQLGEQIWLATNRNLLEFVQQIDSRRTCIIRYEDLATAPAAEMEKLCRFLNLPFDPAMLRPYDGQRMADGVHAKSMPIGDPSFLSHDSIEAGLADVWRTIQLPRPLTRQAAALARQLGYELPGDLTSAEPECEESTIEARGLRFGICAWGPPSGPVIVCVHGMLEQALSWELVARPLAASGFRVIAPDLRGHGLASHAASGGAYHIADFVADLDAILQALGLNSFTLVGHSMGAAISALYAGARPASVRSLLLAELPRPASSQPADLSEALCTQLDYMVKPQEHAVLPSVEAAAERLRRAAPSISPEFALRAAQRLTAPCPGGVQWRWDPRLRNRTGLGFDALLMSPILLLNTLTRMPVPITLVYGESGGPALPNAKLQVLPGGHNLHFEAPTQFAEAIRSLFAPQGAA